MKLNGFAPALILTMGAAIALPGHAQTTVNGRPVTEQQRYQFVVTYGSPMRAGHFWYDSRSGLWGHWGREAAGMLNPGHHFGPLPSNASNGQTRVFVNGRQLNMADVQALRRYVGTVYQGRFWLDGRTGYFGYEGSSQPIGNLGTAQQSARRRREPIWGISELMGGASNSAGTCTKDGGCYYPGQ